MNITIDMPGAIRSLRKSLGLTQVELAEKLSVTPTSVHRYESGSSTPGLGVLRDLFELASQHPASRSQRESFESVLLNRRKKLRNTHASISVVRGPTSRPFLDVKLLASLSSDELDLLEATLALMRSEDENTKRVLRAILEPWFRDTISKNSPISG